jgi:hypothetical protein
MENMMEGFIDAGFDIINPLQWTAEGMDPKRFKDHDGGD